MKIGWLDPAIATSNDGDRIISEVVGREIRRLGPESVIRFSTRRRWTRDELALASTCGIFIVGGTNLLTSHPIRYRQWVVGPAEVMALRKRCVLLGVGWWQYQDPPDLLARVLLRLLLHPDLPHSVRDSYTARQLAMIPRKVTNTSCPTLWGIPRCGRSSYGFRGTVVTTVTDYLRNPDYDRQMLQTLVNRSKETLIWPQGSRDREYVRDLGFERYLVTSGLQHFDDILRAPGVEYVGTRLHAGIRALQFGVPSVIVAIDNRAKEIAADVGLWTVERSHSDLEAALDGFDGWQFHVPDDAIAGWRCRIESFVSH